MSRLPRVLAAVAALGLLTACTTIPGTPVGLRQEQRGPVGAVPAGLERFYGQAIAWGSCESFATTTEQHLAFTKRGIECGRATMPLDYDDPRGRTVSLALLRRPATDQQHRIGSLLINPGGPGASGIEAAAQLGSLLRDSEVAERFDLIGFDPRGVGASEPQVRCLTDEEWDAERLDSDLDTSPEGIAQTEAEEKDYARKCAERTGKDVLSHVGTRDVVRDMDALRSALGDEKLSYVGYSYGTRIGTAYAETFPQNVRAMVLDGAVAPEENKLAQSQAQGQGFKKAFDAFVEWCVGRGKCALGNDPAAAEPRLKELIEPLKKEPRQLGDRKLSFTDAVTAVVQALYSEQLWTVLDTGIADLANGGGRTLLFLADTYLGRDSDGHYSTRNDAFRAIRCVDDPPVTDRDLLREADRKAREVLGEDSVFIAGEPAGVLDACAFWSVPHTSEPHQPKADGLPPLLVISTTGDPATPYQAGVDLARALNASLLTFDGNQHTVFLQGQQCVDERGTRYLVDLKTPEDGARC
ncbi:alpha/beta hydrolase [Longimycelium tulufanense]|uniref:Alpha/beta hydrolase n=1 Tax=Longimycelium tulufanense TaxID=907463 RepID=A0A8J3CGB9_9PSEU|nr:alpha/beta hydrolase [Longimycelium tulufanense]GGM64638.1 alpha/beta hydrolase [Longimycelium tulufanense]